MKQPVEKRITILDVDTKDREPVISFGPAIYKLGEFLSCLRQAIIFNRCSTLNQLLENQGMPKINGDNLIYEAGVPCGVLGLDGGSWVYGNVRVKVTLELITEEKEPPQEDVTESSKSPLDDFRQT